jgi:hypothetical protein
VHLGREKRGQVQVERESQYAEERPVSPELSHAALEEFAAVLLFDETEALLCHGGFIE